MTQCLKAIQPLFTLVDARESNACVGGVSRFTDALKKAHPGADIETIKWSIGDVAAVNLNDAIWCFCLLKDRRQIVEAIMPSVKRVSAYTTDRRIHDCIEGIDQWLAGDDSIDLKALAASAYYAAYYDFAPYAAYHAACAVSYYAYYATLALGANEAAARAARSDFDTHAAEREAQRADIIAAFPCTF